MLGVGDAGWSPTVSGRGGGSGSRRASGLAGALGSGVREERGGGGCGQGSGLEIPSSRESQAPPPRGGTLRTPVPARGSACPVPSARAGFEASVWQRLAGLTVLIRGLISGRPAAPGPFPATTSALPEALGLRELPHCFSSSGLTSVFPAGTALGSWVAFSQTPL